MIANGLVSSGALPDEPLSPGAERLGTTVLMEGVYSSADKADFVVCRTQKDLDEAILKFGITQKKSITADFNSGVVCLGFLGKRSTGGYGLKARAAYYLPRGASGDGQGVLSLLREDGLNPENLPLANLEEGDALVVLKETCPPKDAMLAQVITSPFIILYLKVKNPANVYVSMIGCGGGK